MSQIYEQIVDLVVERFGFEKSKVTPELNIRKDLGADSLDFVELVMELEDIFSVEISDEAAEDINTIGDLVAYIEKSQEA